MGSAGAHFLPEPAHARAWETSQIVPVDSLGPGAGWQRLSADDPRARAQQHPALVPPTWFGNWPGAPLVFEFRGTVLGLIGLKGPENGQFRVTVDDAPPRTATLFDPYSTPGRYLLKPWFYSKHLADTIHRVRIEVVREPPDTSAILAQANYVVTDPAPFATNGLYLSGVLITGDFIGPVSP
jgi:hypothetical protein